MAKTKKTDEAAAAKPPTAAPRRRAAPRKSATPAVPDLPSVSSAQPLAVASDMRAPGMPEGAAEASAAPSHEEIAEAAYHRYLQRGGGHGRDYEDWLEAESTLRSRR
jgi:hypothetical protein